jgi:hypothetical protein
MNIRTRFVVRPALLLLHRRSLARGSIKSPRDLRIEGWLWRFAGAREMARIFADAANEVD